MTEARQGRFTVSESAAGQRLDRYLAEQIDEPRSQVQRWIRLGQVLVEGHQAKGSHSLRCGETVEWTAPLPPVETLIPETGDLRILYQDPEILVIDKPAGLTVHPGAGRSTGTLVHRVLAQFPEISGVGGPGRPGIVHRLDKDTSGVMVMALTAGAYRVLSAAFANRQVEKRYEGIVYGPLPDDRWTVDEPIGRHPNERTKMIVRSDGRPALSHFEAIARSGRLARVAIRIETGRTHQIRVHAKHSGTPLVGDPTYGEARWKGLLPRYRSPLRAFPRPALHARELSFIHPGQGTGEDQPMRFSSPLPDDLRSLWIEVGGADTFAGEDQES